MNCSFIVNSLYSVDNVVKFVALKGVYIRRMLRQTRRNALHCSYSELLQYILQCINKQLAECHATVNDGRSSVCYCGAVVVEFNCV